MRKECRTAVVVVVIGGDSGGMRRSRAELEVCVQRNGGECSRAVVGAVVGGCAYVFKASVPSRQGISMNQVKSK